ncbi:MAG: VWA domain-containing protein, partial [Burkholderiales bacterium]
MLDVVVRDKKGRAVTDLRADEIAVSEDGIRQTIEGFKRIETQPPTVEGAAAPVQPDATRQLSLVTLVFDQLGETGRRQAQRGAEAFLEKGIRANTFVAVFRVDQRLSMLQAFTNDRAKLKAAVASATSGTFTGVTDEKAALEQATAELQRTAGLESATGPGAGQQGGGFAARAQAQALSNMLRMAKDLQRQQNGTTSLYPLIALVKGQQTLGGRKTLLYFTERLDVPPNLDAVFRSVISEANRGNV